MTDGRPRCSWAGDTDPLYLAYHDVEWGVPLHDPVRLFELICLEGAQAGLSWSTILHRRDGYRSAFAGWDPEAVARFGADDQARLLADPRIIRNRAKVASAIGNARAFQALRKDGLDPTAHLWSFVEGRPVQNAWKALAEIPPETDASRAMARDLRRRGLSFVGPTICYAFMRSSGMVNDHLVRCFRHAEVAALA
ncbi:MAG: DNA-3-methyladenine glycosylase I [Chloroflexota bacterium]|nr:DNA-3-methyladenine glycosylase I [Chloroflexota bacterium]